MEELKKQFEALYCLDVNSRVEKKDGLSYLSWAYAWAEFKKIYPDASYSVLRDEQNRPYFGDSDVGFMVYTTVTAGGLTYMMWLPVMDGANKAMRKEKYTYLVRNKNFRYAKLADDGKYYDQYGNEQPEFFEKTCEAMTMFDVNKAVMRCLVKNLAMFGLGLYIYAGEDLPEEIRTEICEVCGKPVRYDIATKSAAANNGHVYCSGTCKKKAEESR